MTIFFGIIMALAGFSMVWKTDWILSNFGHVAWAEAHLGSEGGTRLFYKLLGFLIILIGFSMVTGLHRALLQAFVLPLFGIRSANPLQ